MVVPEEITYTTQNLHVCKTSRLSKVHERDSIYLIYIIVHDSSRWLIFAC